MSIIKKSFAIYMVLDSKAFSVIYYCDKQKTFYSTFKKDTIEFERKVIIYKVMKHN